MNLSTLQTLLSALVALWIATPVPIHGLPNRTAAEEYTLIVSGQQPEAFLVTSTGTVAHRWQGSISNIFPDYDVMNPRQGDRPYYWRYALLRPNGDLVVIFEGIGIALLDKNSTVRWAARNNAHHWITTQDDGSFVHLSRRQVRGSASTYFDDAISLLSESGRHLRRISIPRAIQRSRFSRRILGNSSRPLQGDFLHTNSVTLVPMLDTLPPGVQAGDFLISMRTTNALAIVSRRSGRVVWAHRGPYRRQHAASITSGGSLILFDNLGNGLRGPSRVLTYHVPSMQLTSTVQELSSGETFFSKLLGAVSRLPSGNFLITESGPGRALEVTPSGELVWEYAIPTLPPSQTRIIALLAHAERITSELLTWLPTSG